MNNRLLLGLVVFAILALALVHASAKHLLHQLPADAAEQILLNCQKTWNGEFGQGWCADNDAEAWLAAHQRDGQPDSDKAKQPDLLVNPPDIIIRPPDADANEQEDKP